jgi:hypothetical protein
VIKPARFEHDGVEQVHAVTLRAPVGEADEITFRYTPLEDVASVAVGEPTDELPAELGPVSLFIDVSATTGSPGTDTGN